jgi:hypothetical protein
VDNSAVHKPCDAAGPPVDSVEVEVQRGVEIEINAKGRASIAKANRHPIVAWIEVDVDEHASLIVPGQFDIDLLPRCISVEKETRDQTGTTGSHDFRFKTSVLEEVSGGEGSRTVRPVSSGNLADDEMRATLIVHETISRKRREVSWKSLGETRE